MKADCGGRFTDRAARPKHNRGDGGEGLLFTAHQQQRFHPPLHQFREEKARRHQVDRLRIHREVLREERLRRRQGLSLEEHLRGGETTLRQEDGDLGGNRPRDPDVGNKDFTGNLVKV